jgi:hypothetical protein
VGNKNEKFRTTEHHDGNVLMNVRRLNQPSRMLVDTGAQISVLKSNLIPDNIPICTDEQYATAGITNGSIEALGNADFTFHDPSYRLQVAPEEIQLNEHGLILKDSIIHNREGYIDICGHKYPICVKPVKSLTLKPQAKTIAKDWVELDDGFCIAKKETIYPGMYVGVSKSSQTSSTDRQRITLRECVRCA